MATEVPFTHAIVEMESAVDQSNPLLLPSLAKRHDELWFDDGSIVLQVQTTLFRVHRSFLVTHSEIFADLFLVPQPHSFEVVDDCPIVCLHDSPDDFVHFLKALYDPCYFDSFVTAPGDLIPTPLHGILRLATKYCVPKIRRKGLAILRKAFAVTLDEFEFLSPLHRKSVTVGCLTEALALAQEIRVLDILPCLFYILSTFSVEDILRKASTRVSFEDLTVCLIGRERLLEMQRSQTMSIAFNFEASPRCLLEDACQRRQPSPDLWKLHRIGAFSSVVALSRLTLKADLKKFFQVCSECVTDAEIRHVNGRKHVWDQLPVVFNLGSWEELLKARNEDL